MEDNARTAGTNSGNSTFSEASAIKNSAGLAPNEATVIVGENVITELEPVENTSACKQKFTEVGLNVRTVLRRIDDNGFVTFSIFPVLQAPDKTVTVPGCGSQTITTVASRALSSGFSRVRDGQTLLLTGVLNDREVTVSKKVPLLGDFPLFGSLFRSSANERRKRELVITVTPRVLKDDFQESYGYYSPSTTEARNQLGR